MQRVKWVWGLVAFLSLSTWAKDPTVLNSPTLGTLICLPGGTFQMGSPEEEVGRDEDETQHLVTISEFCMMETEVTQEAYQAITGKNPSFPEYMGISLLGASLPVQNVSWYNAVAYANAVSQKEQLVPAYTIHGTEVSWDKKANGYRLPTEAEWEYAARGGQETRYAGTSKMEEVCRYGSVHTASSKTQFKLSWNGFACEDNNLAAAPVKSFQPNGYNIYDLTGNVWEWVWDGYGDYSISGDTIKEGSIVNPYGNNISIFRTIRGGSWFDDPQMLRNASRSRNTSGDHGDTLGFRLVRNHH